MTSSQAQTIEIGMMVVADDVQSLDVLPIEAAA